MQYSDGQQVVVARCPLCGAREFTEHAGFAQFTWVRCRCGLVYKRSVAAAATAAAASVGGEGSFGESGYGKRYSARHAHRVRKSRRQILDVLNHAPRGPLLDIGCSLGYTLQAARELGLAPTGVDVSGVAVAHCRALGHTAEPATLERLPFGDAHFAIVTMKHVLEHTAIPRAALGEVRRVLRPGGALFIAVPNAQYRKAVRNPRRSRFFRPDAHGGIEHWVYYSPQTLSRLLIEEGFDVLRVHPQLWQRHAAPWQQLLQGLAWPARLLAQWLLDVARARKEFWIVARRR